MKHPIPDEALDDRLAFTGTSGSGKSYNAGGAVERVLARSARVVIIDPLGVWYGLRLLADGKTPSPHDVVIFGSPHGDLPITEHAGALTRRPCREFSTDVHNTPMPAKRRWKWSSFCSGPPSSMNVDRNHVSSSGAGTKVGAAKFPRSSMAAGGAGRFSREGSGNSLMTSAIGHR
jgi:hypothetical protein